MFKNNEGVVKQNLSGNAFLIDGKVLPSMGLYGTYRDLTFVAENFINEKQAMVMFCHRTVTKQMKKEKPNAPRPMWKRECRPEIVNLILQAAKAGEVKVYVQASGTTFSCPKLKDSKQVKERQELARDSMNPDVVRSHHHKISKAVNRTGIPRSSNEYLERSYWLYGTRIEMGQGSKTRMRPMTERMARYMDGTGVGADRVCQFGDNKGMILSGRGDMRPLNPQFPVKSGKRK